MTNKPKIAIIRGKFLNRYEMQFFEPLIEDFDITAFGSLTPYHDRFVFPVVKLPSPMDIPDFPYKMPVLNRLCIDAHYLWGLEEKLKGFDLVHSAETYFHYTQQALTAKRKGYVKKVIATVLENIPFNNEGIWGRKAFKERARNELDHIIALTNKTKEALLAEGADVKKITVISHYVDTKRFHPVQKRDSKNLTVLFVGRLEEEKGVLDVVQVARLFPDVRFLFVGDGSLKNRVLEHRMVSYDEMPAVYREADIFVAPSKPRVTWEEQYNTALLEAQASGLPIVTTSSGGIPENVGDAAMIVPPGDVRAIAESLKRFILNASLRRQYGIKARARAERVHDITIGSRKLKDLYLSLLP
jgi:glycosyltransferase involved in cell wall biosynthesis